MTATDQTGPLVIAQQGWFYAGGSYDETQAGKPMTGQMYVEFQIPEKRTCPWPLVFVHGGQQNGTDDPRQRGGNPGG